MRRITNVVFGIGMMLGLTGCLPSQWEYLVEHNGRVTQEQIKDRFGDPYLIRDIHELDEQGTMWTYRYEVKGSPIGRRGDMIGGQPCIEYVLTFNDQKILANWTRQPCAPFRINPRLMVAIHTTAVNDR
ncbi:MAG TPA: hypothetical protein VGQ60_03295 [Nitrospiraceae bacterium]|jgi:hypothetical protein|nr:hypothetical protein [Nitrospiraceae bacterium]